MKDFISILAIIAIVTTVFVFLVIPFSSGESVVNARETNLKWEYIESDGPDFYRARIYGGWLISKGTDLKSPITFIPLQNPDGWEIKPITNQNKAK